MCTNMAVSSSGGGCPQNETPTTWCLYRRSLLLETPRCPTMFEKLDLSVARDQAFFSAVRFWAWCSWLHVAVKGKALGYKCSCCWDSGGLWNEVLLVGSSMSRLHSAKHLSRPQIPKLLQCS